LIEGLVLGGTNNVFEVESADGSVRLCSIKGKVLREAEGYYNPLAPGDRVTVQEDEHDAARGQILSLLPRRNHFVRLNQKLNAPQLLASNLDFALIVTTPDEPPFRPRFVDRAIIQAVAEHITPVVVLNKCDLAIDDDTEDRLADWERLGYRVLRVSARTGAGLDDLLDLLAGHASAFVGQSGVGKSSLLNALDRDVGARTASLSEKYGRGTHTTTKGSLFHLAASSGVTSIIDTPGVRRFMLHDIAADDVALYFPEMEKLIGSCSWGMSCTHESEPGCKILEAVYAGVIHEQRYESWQRIRDEIRTGRLTD